MRVRWSNLPDVFTEPEEILAEIRELVRSGDYTLGKAVGECERAFADLIGTQHAIGVGSGTDALKLALRAAGVGHGDEVVTCANTFYGTIGAIAELGARPVLIDCDDSFCMDLDWLEGAIGPRTRAIMPVQLTGDMVDMPRLMAIADSRGLPVVEDACQSMLSAWEGKPAGTWGVASGFSLHPIKLINVWGDAGFVVTDDDALAAEVRLLRNHGLKNRDEMVRLGYNTRLDSLQAIVGKWVIARASEIADARIPLARRYDAGLAGVPGIRLPPRRPAVRNTHFLYIVFAERRDALLAHLVARGVEAKVHYPIPIYRQDALKPFGYKKGDFPVTDRHALEMVTLPLDQHLSEAHVDYVVEQVREFYAHHA